MTTDQRAARPARIALYGAGGAPYHHAAAFARAGHEVAFVYPVDIVEGALSGFDAFVMPGGGYGWMQGQIEPLGEKGTRALHRYVSEGGMYLGSCAGAYDAATVPEAFLSICPIQENMCLLEARVWNGSGWPGLVSPGVGVLRVRNVNPQHPVMRGMPAAFEMTHYNGPLFEGGDSLAVVEGYTDQFTPAERFLGPGSGPLLVDEAARVGVSNVVAGELGEGRVVLFGSHPEFGFTLGMDDVQAPSQMLANAIRWQLDATRNGERPSVALAADDWQGSQRELVARAHELATGLRRLCESLVGRGSQPSWLRSDRALSLFGMTPDVIWAQALSQIEGRTTIIEQQLADLDARTLGFQPPPGWQVDFGYYGIVPLLEQAHGMLAAAERSWDVDIPFSDDAYAHLEDSPYHLVAGSYLAAVGRVIAADLMCRVGRSATEARDWPVEPAPVEP